MSQHIRVSSIKRKQLDEDKLALAFLLLAKILDETELGNGGHADPTPGREAA
jgi:hypothetical protein